MTARTIAYLKASVFEDGQPDDSIDPLDMRDFVDTLDVRSVVSVKQFGAVGDGVADDTAAFQAAVTYVKSLLRNSSVSNDLPGPSSRGALYGVKILIPRGDYLITSAKALMDFDVDVVLTTAWGLDFEGESRRGVQIIYKPSVAGTLCFNDRCILGLTFKNLVFYCNSATSDFLQSTAGTGGGSQDFVFDNCTWTGTWQYGLHLTGDDDNSEFHFLKCTMIGAWTSFFWSETSDQFLNYWWDHCNYQCSSNWIRMTKGGSVHLTGCVIAGYAPTSDTYLIELVGQAHSDGIQSFSINQCYFEQRTNHGLILKCEWGSGNVMINGLFNTSDVGATDGSTLFFKFDRGISFWGPAIKFTNCQLMGRHEYHWAGDSQWYSQSIVYDTCAIYNYRNARDFIVSVNDGSNAGGAPNISFRNCTTPMGVGQGICFDTDLDWNKAAQGKTTRKLVNPHMAWGDPPVSNQIAPFQLPKGSVITAARWFLPASAAGANGSPYGWKLSTILQDAVIPDAILTQTSLTGAIGTITDDPLAPDGTWMTSNSDSVANSIRVSTPTPAHAPLNNYMGNLQLIQVWARKRSAIFGFPTVTLTIKESGTARGIFTGVVQAVTSTTGQLLEFAWDAQILSTANGSAVEIQLDSSVSGTTVEYGAIRWLSAYAGTTVDSISGSVLSAGFNVTTPLWFPCDTDVKRTLYLQETAGNGTFGAGTYISFEYVG